MRGLKKRLPYLLAFIPLLLLEIIIAVFVHDRFIRPYVGDVLVTVLLCCLGRVIHPEKPRWLAVWVLLFSFAVEGLQGLNIAGKLGLTGTWLGILIGSTFDLADMVCYAVGCLLFFFAEWIAVEKQKGSPKG